MIEALRRDISELKAQNVQTRDDYEARLAQCLRDNDGMKRTMDESLRRADLADSDRRKAEAATEDQAKQI